MTTADFPRVEVPAAEVGEAWVGRLAGAAVEAGVGEVGAEVGGWQQEAAASMYHRGVVEAAAVSSRHSEAGVEEVADCCLPAVGAAAA
jgi:hypothetical protein